MEVRAYLLIVVVLTGISACRAVEISSEKPIKPSDWSRFERLEYQRLSEAIGNATALLRKLPTVQTFVRAANVNTLANRPSEYNSISERAAYYDLMSLVIEHEPLTPKAKRGVRFFHATTIVTSRMLLGAAEWLPEARVTPVKCLEMSKATQSFVEDVNAQLFSINMDVLRNFLFIWSEPKNPITGLGTQSALEFDLTMVEKEQSAVSLIINAVKPSKEVRAQLNTLYGKCLYQNPVIRWINPVGTSAEWAEKARGEAFDFFNERHRILQGKAIIAMLHKKDESDFRKAVGK